MEKETQVAIAASAIVAGLTLAWWITRNKNNNNNNKVSKEAIEL